MSQTHPPTGQPQREPQPLDLRERGAGDAASDRRLFVQFHAWTDCYDSAVLAETLLTAGLRGALYEDLNDPAGVGVVAFSESPGDFLGPIRKTLQADPFVRLTPRPEMTMFGRTYAVGYERDLDEALIDKPVGRLLDPDAPWCVWYPLRRNAAFNRLPDERRKAMLKEHGSIGFRFGAAGAAFDVRLACHGLDAADNDFVIGLLGPQLAPLSKLVEAMRATEQTAEWLDRLGPFFVGRKSWQSGDPDA